METNSQFGGALHNTCFMSLSLGGVCQDSGEEVSRKVMLNMKSQLRDWMVGSGSCDPGMTCHNCKENCSVSSCEYFKGSTGKRCIHSYGTGGDVPLEDDLKLGLGLGCTPGSRNGGGRSEKGISSGTSCLEGRKQDHLPVDLDLGLTRSCGLELTNDCLTSSRVVVSNMTSLEQASQCTETEGCLHGRLEGRLHRTALIQLENLHSFSQDRKNGGDAARDSSNLISASGENTCGMDLQLGLSATPYSADSDCLPYFIGNDGDAQESGVDVTECECVRLVDEGSTSGRWMKSKGLITSVLHCGHSRVNQTNCLSPAIPLPEDTTNLDLSTRKKSAAVSASACEAFTGLSRQIPKMTASDSSIGALARSSDRASKTCKFKGCGKGARGASGLCIAHGGGRRCQRPNCNKGAEGRTLYCKAHGGGRRCQRLGCIKSAEGKTDFCIGHGGGRRCNYEGCNKAARGKSGLCIRHGGGKRCQKEGCTKSAEGYAGLCISHGGGRRCQYLGGCGKGAQGSTIYCKAHGGGRRCEFEGCTKGAEGSTPCCKAHGGGKRCIYGGGTCTKSVHGGTSFCVAHGGGKRCAIPGCTKSARGRTDHCVKHGGGKRCKFENCSKSAQGSTDFCKAHGGGKKCSWCQEGSTYSENTLNDKAVDHLKKPCDRFARGKTGLCAAHSAIMQKLRVSWDGTSSLSYSKGTIPDGVNELESRSIDNELSFPSFSDASEQPSQSSSDHDEQPSGTAESQVLLCARAGIEGRRNKRGHHHVENESSHVTQSRRHFAADVASQDVNFDGGHTDISSSRMESHSNWLFPQLTVPNKISSAVNMTDNVAVKQHPYERPGNSILRPEVSFSSTQLVFPPRMQKEDLLLRDNMQHMGHAFSLSASDNISSVLSLSFPEERVHGGGLMALLAKEAARHNGLR